MVIFQVVLCEWFWGGKQLRSGFPHRLLHLSQEIVQCCHFAVFCCSSNGPLAPAPTWFDHKGSLEIIATSWCPVLCFTFWYLSCWDNGSLFGSEECLARLVHPLGTMFLTCLHFSSLPPFRHSNTSCMFHFCSSPGEGYMFKWWSSSRLWKLSTLCLLTTC